MLKALKGAFSETYKRDTLIADFEQAYLTHHRSWYSDQKPLRAILNFYAKHPNDDAIAQTLQKGWDSTIGRKQEIDDTVLFGFEVIKHMKPLLRDNFLYNSKFESSIGACRKQLVVLVEEILGTLDYPPLSRNYDTWVRIWAENCGKIASIDAEFGRLASDAMLRIRDDATEKSAYAKSEMTIFAVKYGDRSTQLKALGQDPNQITTPHITTLR